MRWKNTLKKLIFEECRLLMVKGMIHVKLIN